MAFQQSAQETDVLLEQWIRETDASRAQELLHALVCHHAEPLIRRIVKFKLEPANRGAQPADIEDVCGTALYNLLARLQHVKSNHTETVVRNFSGYAAVVAYNACNEYFRMRRPAWVRLSMRVRYMATHVPEISLWQSAEGCDVCGLVRDRGREANSDLAKLRESCKSLWQTRDPARLGLGELAEAILTAAGGPLIFDDLVDVIAECSGVREIRVQSSDDAENPAAARWDLADLGPSAEARLSHRQYIQQLWKEICDLSLEHRTALLFNLQDSAGGDIQLLPALGIATIREIAQAVGMDPLRFAELWNQLPLDDIAIARQLGLSRQDVANRRSSARKRLARKMKEFECRK